jgi:natural product precursor
MKPKKFSKKLTLNKKNIACLNDSEMNSAQGGVIIIVPRSMWVCNSELYNCPKEA